MDGGEANNDNNNESSDDDDHDHDHDEFPIFLHWDVRRNEIVERGENLKEATLQHIRDVDDFLHKLVFTETTAEFVFNTAQSLVEEFNDDEDIMTALAFSHIIHEDLLDIRVLQLSRRLRNNQEFMMKMIEHDPEFFQLFSRDLRGDPKTALATFSTGSWPEALRHATEDLKSNKPFMLQAVERDGNCLEYANETLRDDDLLVSKAVQKCPDAIQWASPRLRDNIQIALDAVTKDGLTLLFVSPRLRNDFTVALAAVRQIGMAIQFASEPLRDNIQVALEAVTTHGSALQFVSPRLQNDLTVALAAVRQNGMAIQDASEPLRDNIQLALEAVTRQGSALRLVSSHLQNDFTVALAAVRKDGGVLKYASEPLQKNIEIRASSNLQLLRLPQTDVLVNQEKTPSSIFPYLFDRVVGNSNRYVQDQRLTIYYLLKNRIDLIPSDMDLTTVSSDDTKCKKRKRCEETK